MSAINPVLSSGLPLDVPQSQSRDPEKIKHAASQFESLLIGQVFKSMHEDGGGWLGSGDDDTASSAMGMADEYLAQAICARGGLGLAQMIARQLSSPTSSNPVPPSPAPDSDTSNSGR